MAPEQSTTPDDHDLTGAYALDALKADERRAFEDHLDGCTACRRGVAELQAAAAVLGRAEAEPPPAGLEQRVMGALGDHPQAEVPARLDDRRRAPDGLAARGMGPSAAVRGALLAVAGVLTIAVVGLGALLVQTTTRAERLEQQLADAGSSDVASLLALPDARVADLDAPAGTSARFVYSAERNRGILVSHGLSPLPADRVYALWLIEGEAPVFAGDFRPDEQGRAVAAVDGDVRAADLVGVTVEPAGPIGAPTGEILISGPLV
jgi:anti-sigma-K factor RskA